MRFRILTALIAVCACFPAFGNKVVIGKLGQALQEADIYSRPSSRSHVYYRVKAYQYLVIRDARSASYYKVVLQTGACGYILASEVAQLPYSVTADESPTPSYESRDNIELSSRSRAAVANWSLNFQGTPYKWGGTDPQRGIDCSAFVKFLYGQIGLKLPRTAAQQALVGTPVRRLQDLEPGDRLYFWSYERNMIGHTGIYLGNGLFCHSEGGHGVTTSALTKKWLAILFSARR